MAVTESNMTAKEEGGAQKGTDQGKTRPIPDEATWRLLLEEYRKVKDGSNDGHDGPLFKKLEAGDRGMRVPFQVRESPGKGRGLFALELIPKDAIIYEDRCARFSTETQWRTFLSSLPRDLAGDVVSWAGVDEDEGDQEIVWLDLSEAALMNHGYTKPSVLARMFRPWNTKKKRQVGEFANVETRFTDGAWCIHAKRDIQPGEEILTDYHKIHDFDHSLTWFDELEDEYATGLKIHELGF